MFEAYGNIISCKCVSEKRYGFVKFGSYQEAEMAIQGLTGFELGGSMIQVRFADNDQGKGGGKGGGKDGWDQAFQTGGGGYQDFPAPPAFGGKGDKGGKSDPEPSDNLYIKGLPVGSDEQTLRTIFGAYGAVTSCKVLSQPDGAVTAAAMVRMGTLDQATWMVQNLNGNIPQGLTDPILVKYATQSGGKGKGDP